MMTHEYIEELMSLKLDGGLDKSGERHLDEHLQNCAGCAQIWSFYQKADQMLKVSAAEPVPVPTNFHAKIMVQISVAPVLLAQSERAVSIESTPFFVAHASTGRLADTPSLHNIGIGVGVPSAPLAHVSVSAATSKLPVSPTLSLPDFAAEWQKQAIFYIRNTAAVIVSVAGVLALLLALVMSGAIKVDGAAGDGISTIRTFFDAVGAWVGSFFATSGTALLAGATLLVSLLLLVGWQVVAGYQRSALENRGQTGALTGSLTGPLEVAA